MTAPFTEEKANELYAMVKENNRMLKSMRRDAFIGGVLHFVWMVVILVVLPYLTWLWLQPYLEPILKAYEQAQGQSSQISQALNEIQNAGSGFNLQELIEKFTGGTGKN